MTEPDVQLSRELVHVGVPLPLSSGRRVWVTTCSEGISQQGPEPVPAAVIMKVMRPDEDDVSCPGVLMVGANWNP